MFFENKVNQYQSEAASILAQAAAVQQELTQYAAATQGRIDKTLSAHNSFSMKQDYQVKSIAESTQAQETQFDISSRSIEF